MKKNIKLSYSKKGGSSMSRAELKSMAKEQLKGNWGTVIAILIIIAIISYICSIIPDFGWIVAIITTPALSLGSCIVYLKISRKESTEISDLFEGFKKIGKALWLNILITFFTMLWSLLLIIPGIIKSYAYSMAYYILADNPELTAREALARSKEIMQGHKAELFVLHLSFFWWYLLILVSCGFATLYVTPYMSATVANFYNSIKECQN